MIIRVLIEVVFTVIVCSRLLEFSASIWCNLFCCLVFCVHSRKCASIFQFSLLVQIVKEIFN